MAADQPVAVLPHPAGPGGLLCGGGEPAGHGAIHTPPSHQAESRL